MRENPRTMKITDVRAIQARASGGTVHVVKIDTDEGLYGVGEAGLSSRELAVAGAVQHYRELLIGQDPMRIGHLWQLLYRSQYFEGGRVLTAAQSAIDIALHDLKGKALGVPVHQLLGGKQRETVATYGTVYARKSINSVEDLIETSKACLSRGWNCLRILWADPHNDEDKTRIFEPWETIGRTAEWLTQLRAAVGKRPVLGVEYHHRLSVAEAASFCQRMPPGTIDWIEEPIRDETPEAYEALRRLTPVPFAVGEEFSSKWQFLPYIERGIASYARLDICNVGGFTEAMKVASACEVHYIDMMPHNPLGPICTAASIHFAAAIPNYAWLEVWDGADGSRRWEADEVFPKLPMLTKDRVSFDVPDAPGLGIEFDEAAATREPFKLWNVPNLTRRDGSVQNW
jgi:galactonate dehydratase